MIHPFQVTIALELCKEIWWKTYIVWGAVRDIVMGKVPKDVDLATNVPISDICHRFETHDIGKNKDFGIVVVIYKWFHFEVAHFRKDGKYSDSRRPDSVQLIDDLYEDLARRDFTMNAMAYDGENIIDPYNWKQDIKKWIIRFVWNPNDRITEDNLRVLRAYRFAARYNFDIADELVMKWYSLLWVAQERVTDELKKVASYGWKPLASFIHRLTNNSIVIIPEIQSNHLSQSMLHHPEWSVFNHIIQCLCVSDIENYLVNLCILFHDVGKLNTYNLKDGKHTFYGHDTVGAEMMEAIGKRMKFSTDEIETMKYVCRNHMIWRWMTDMKKSRMADIIVHKDYPILEQVCLCDELGRLYMWDIFKRATQKWIIDLTRVLYDKKSEYDKKIKSFVDGRKIMELRPDLEWSYIGIVKNIVVEYITDRDFKVDQEEVEKIIKNYNKELKIQPNPIKHHKIP